MIENEINDMQTLIDILIEEGVVKQDLLTSAKLAKKEKLKQWANLYK